MNNPTRSDLANAVRVLSADAVQNANSGHPGAPMGMADIAEVLWNDFFLHNPQNPNWFNRDRFVLSNGHGSMLLYSVLHLSGYDLTKVDLANFRQLHSKTPGHPEYGYTPGVDTTTGPLGQGVANGVGMAIAEQTLAREFNTPEYELVNHHTYVFLGDGCMMEGISHEACSLAGNLKLNKLIIFWDDNGISIDGDVSGWFTDDTPRRFTSYGWNVIENVDGHDAQSISNAIHKARECLSGPTLICCKTVIGKGAPTKEGSESCHGAPLGEEEINKMRESLGWNSEPFDIPQNIADRWDARSRGDKLENTWLDVFAGYKNAYPEKAVVFERRINGQLPNDWSKTVDAILSKVNSSALDISSRQASLNALNELGPLLPEFLGGSADLASSNFTIWNGSKSIGVNQGVGNYVHYGVREFAMSAIANGASLHGGFKPYVGTFLVFSDYMRNGMRMSALMKLPVIYVLTHDSIGLGEDGPTHQPVEHASSLRLIPNMHVWRPCDAVESMVAWICACEATENPSSLIFSRQALPHQVRDNRSVESVRRGGYVLLDSDGAPDLIIIATGSEVDLAVQARKHFKKQGVEIRVVSMPCAELFNLQSSDYQESVLPTSIRSRVVIEAGITDYWYRYAGLDGLVLGMTTFGESAPAHILFEHFGLSNEKIIKEITTYLGRG